MSALDRFAMNGHTWHEIVDIATDCANLWDEAVAIESLDDGFCLSYVGDGIDPEIVCKIIEPVR